MVEDSKHGYVGVRSIEGAALRNVDRSACSRL